MKTLKRLVCTLLTAALLMAAAGCGDSSGTPSGSQAPAESGGQSEAASGDAGEGQAESNADGEKVIVYGLNSSWNRLMPYDLSAMTTVMPNDKIFDRLVYLTDDGIGMRAAKDIQVEDEGRTFVITLREESMWHDGTPVTSADWLWTFQTVSDPEFTGISKSYLSFFTGTDGTGSVVDGQEIGVKAPDDYTLVFHFEDAMYPEAFFAPNNWYLPVMPKHLLEDIPAAELNDHAFWTNPIGSGPCRFVSEIPGAELTLEAFDDYYLGRPQFDKLIYKVVESAAAPTALLAGEIDTCFAALAPDDALALDGQNGLHADKMDGATVNLVVALNNELFPPTVRKAFDMTIDKELILNSLMGGHGDITQSYLLPSSRYANNDLEYIHDPEAAKTMLDEAGFDYDRTYTLAAGNALRERQAVIIQQNLAEIGVKIEIVTGDGTALMAQARTGEMDMLMLSFTTNASPLYMMAHMNSDTPNYSRLQDPKYYELQVAISSEQDEAARIGIAKQAQEVYNQEIPYIPLFQQHVYMVASQRLHNITVGNSDACWLWEVD